MNETDTFQIPGFFAADGNAAETGAAKGDHGFDNTPPNHRYLPHVADWNEGDPLWQEQKGKGIIGALNYLAEQGMNVVNLDLSHQKGDYDLTWFNPATGEYIGNENEKIVRAGISLSLGMPPESLRDDAVAVLRKRK